MKMHETSSSSTVKHAIRNVVQLYAMQHPRDYNAVCKAIAGKRKLNRNEFASLEGTKFSRALFEIPEDLHTALVQRLSEDELKWFKSIPGSRWFAKTFREFSLPDVL